MAFQATRQRQGGPVENLGPANASIQNIFRVILDNAVAEFIAWFEPQPARTGANMNMIVRTSPEFSSDFSLKGDFSDRASFVGFLGGQIVDPVNEVESSVRWTVEITNKTTIYAHTEIDGLTTELGGNPNTSAKVIDQMTNAMADEFYSQLIAYGPATAAPELFTGELQTVAGNQIDYRVIEV